MQFCIIKFQIDENHVILRTTKIQVSKKFASLSITKVCYISRFWIFLCAKIEIKTFAVVLVAGPLRSRFGFCCLCSRAIVVWGMFYVYKYSEQCRCMSALTRRSTRPNAVLGRCLFYSGALYFLSCSLRFITRLFFRRAHQREQCVYYIQFGLFRRELERRGGDRAWKVQKYHNQQQREKERTRVRSFLYQGLCAHQTNCVLF